MVRPVKQIQFKILMKLQIQFQIPNLIYHCESCILRPIPYEKWNSTISSTNDSLRKMS